jgi:hypothetical protein
MHSTLHHTHTHTHRPVDPSLYLDRFAKKLGFKDQASQVVETALHLVASMKRDWMQTGRRPSGICGAALYLAAHIHGARRLRVLSRGGLMHGLLQHDESKVGQKNSILPKNWNSRGGSKGVVVTMAV